MSKPKFPLGPYANSEDYYQWIEDYGSEEDRELLRADDRWKDAKYNEDDEPPFEDDVDELLMEE